MQPQNAVTSEIPLTLHRNRQDSGKASNVNDPGAPIEYPRAQCLLSCVPVRRGRHSQTEMTTQVLFGETCQILERAGVMWRIRLEFDSYEGWVDGRQFAETNDPEQLYTVVGEIWATAESASRTLHLPLGAVLPDYHDGKFRLGGELFRLNGKASRLHESINREALLQHALRYEHAPYVWGGRTPFGLDCSGLTQMSYRAFGVRLLRDSSQQISQGRQIHLADAEPGDLAFFTSTRDGSSHVGLVFPSGKVLHASGCVRLDELDEEGIKHASHGECSHRLTQVRRVVG